MVLDRRNLPEGFLALDAETQRQLIDLAERLSPHRDVLAQVWSRVFQEAEDKIGALPGDPAAAITADLLDPFFDHVPKGDFEQYYLAVMTRGQYYQESGFPYGRLMLAIHHFEQVMLPFLNAMYPQHEDLERALVALDHLSDNAIVLIATSYYEKTLGELRGLQRVTDTALSTLDVDRLVESLLERVVEAIGGDMGAIALRDDEEGGSWRVRRYLGVEGEQPGFVFRSGTGIVGRVGATGRTIQVADASTDPAVIDPVIKHAGVRGMLAVPLELGGRVIGVLYAGRRSPNPFQHAEADLLRQLAQRAALAIEHAQLYQRTAHLLRQTAALQRISTGITANMALQEILDTVIEGVREVFGASRAAIFLRDEVGCLVCPTARGLSDQYIDSVITCDGETLVATAIDSGQTYYATEAGQSMPVDMTLMALEREGIQTALVLPFGRGGEVRGALGLYHDDVRRFPDDERRLAQVFADQAAIAIANATLYRQIRERAADLDRANASLQILDRMKADFLAMVSHELRTPLTAILGYADLLLRGARGDLAERQLSDLKIIRSNGQRLLTLVNDLIEFSSIEAGRSPLSLAAVQLEAVITEALSTITPLAESHGVKLEAQLRASLPTVLADKAAVQKILNQLVSNAVKFTQSGGRVVVDVSSLAGGLVVQPGAAMAGSCRTSDAGPDRSFVVISVRDDGIGIPAEQLSRIWDRFYQVDSSSARRFGGTGLGLAIVKRLVELQGGCVWAESEGIAGKGSTFSFSLPASESAAAL